VHTAGVELIGFFEPASECGGDWWLWRRLGEDRIIVLIADVTGHGLPAALITATAIGCAETLADDIGPEQALRQLNRAVTSAGKGKFWMSCFVTVFDLKTGRAEYANAGHPMPYVARRRGDTWKIDSLAARGPLLGEHPLPAIRVRSTELAPEDVIFWYTDGLNECFGPDGKPWGDLALRRAFEAAVAELDERDAADGDPTTSVRDRVIAAVRAYADSTPQRDDLTVVVGTGVG
jgi:serine phosphatase RsbU (regulator of sigma subunit)